MKALFRKQLGKLIPAEHAAEEWLGKIKIGELVFVEPKRARNPAHHAKFFALLTKVYKNQEHYRSVDEILAVFKIAVGHCDIVQTRKFGEVRIPKSISFANMPQDEFEVFYDKALDFCVTEVIPGLGKEALEAEITSFL